METPADLKYTKEHEWLRLEGDLAFIGITDFAQDELGDIVYLELPAEGTKLEQFAKFGEIESVKAVSDLYSPVTAEVMERNQSAMDAPELVNGDPYGEGWLIKVKLLDGAEAETLMGAEEYGGLTAGSQ
ncbi:MAG: glycine cleavage system protein GcvH [Dehalococcoidia bacterium]|nr:glycine cleavage system protein GcvH [Dehalococcoidia bacterium]